MLARAVLGYIEPRSKAPIPVRSEQTGIHMPILRFARRLLMAGPGLILICVAAAPVAAATEQTLYAFPAYGPNGCNPEGTSFAMRRGHSTARLGFAAPTTAARF